MAVAERIDVFFDSAHRPNPPIFINLVAAKASLDGRIVSFACRPDEGAISKLAEEPY
jgi:hypothetical protein